MRTPGVRVDRHLTCQSIQAAKPTPVETQHEDTIVRTPSVLDMPGPNLQ